MSRGKVRPLVFVIGAVGVVCLGYAFAFALRNGFALSWEGNWDPVIVGIAGTALVALAMTVSAVLDRLGTEGRGTLLRSVARVLAEVLLTFIQYAGVFLVTWSFALFLAFERAGQESAGAFAMTLVGIAANRIGAILLRRVRRKPAKKETFVSSMEDEDAP